MSSHKFIITDMLNELKRTRSSIQIQNTAIADILDKSNKVLLQIEASRCIKPAANENATLYTYNKETVNALTKVVDRFMKLLNDCHIPVENENFDEYLKIAEHKADYLNCNIRKLLAIWNTVQQMRMVFERKEVEINSENESDEVCF